MPELPEVETIRRQLELLLMGRIVRSVDILTPKIFYGDKKMIIGVPITAVRRRAKILILEIANDFKILVHLKMSGQLVIKSQKSKIKNQSIDKHTHVIFTLDNGAQIFYNDIRKFGWVKIIGPREKLAFLESLGPEPLEKEFTLDYFTEIIKFWKRAIKLLLMDQTKIAGVGNIYANETLFIARIHPSKKGVGLKPYEVKKLHESLRESLEKGIRFGGSSRTNYVDAEGKKGCMQEHFLVYDREGEPCFNCGVKIEKITLGGRGTYYCPKCQKEN